MGFFKRAPKVEERTSLANPDAYLLDAFGVQRSSSGQRVNERTALSLAGVFSAVEKISEAVGQLPLKVYRIGDDDQRVEARSHRMWRILHDAPNEYTTAHTFWSTVTASLLLRGNAFILKERDENDEVESLYLLDPASVTIEWDGNVKRFVVYFPTKIVYTTEDVTHIMGFSLDGWVGCSRITYCKNTIGNALARSEFEGGFYARGARMPGVIQYPGPLGPDGLTNLADTFKNTHGGVENMHKVPVLEEGATFQNIGMSLEDMQFVENAQLSLTEIAVLFNLPPAYLGGSTGDSLTYATTESNQIQFAQMGVSPLTNRIAKALTMDPAILPRNRMYAEFTIEAMLRADMRTRVEYWKALKDMGVVDAEYIASRENLPPPPADAEVTPAPEPTNGTVALPASRIGG